MRNHINLCPNCSRQLEHERLTHTFLVDALRRACVEKAPESLYESIHSQLIGAGSATEVVTTYSMTEISIEIDEFGQIEHREVTIEHTEEIRFLNDGSDSESPDSDSRGR